jgi:hypothetical protein
MNIWRFSALSLFVLFYTFAWAQISKPEKGSKWVYDYSNAGSFGPKMASYDRDSLLEGKLAMVLDETFYELANPQKQIYYYVGNIVAIEDSLVWYWNNEEWDTLYDFGAEVGEGWNYYFYFSTKDTVVSRVLEKGTDSDLGVYMILEYEMQYEWEDTATLFIDTVYERTLGGSIYIIPWDRMTTALDGQSGGPLMCFSNSKGRYSERKWTAGGAACTDIIEKLSVGESTKLKMFSIYPNPSSGIISISAHQKPVRMEVYSTLGDLVYSSETEFKTQTLSPQLYVVKLWRNDGGVEVHRVLVE